MDMNNYEYMIDQKGKKKWKIIKLLTVLAYAAFAGIYFLIVYLSKFLPLGSVIPLAVWILAFFTWRYTKPVYKFSFDSGAFVYTIVYGDRTKREKVRTRISAAKMIAPIADVMNSEDAKNASRVYDASNANYSNLPIYGMLFEENGKFSLLKFNANKDAIKRLRYYNQNTVVIQIGE